MDSDPLEYQAFLSYAHADNDRHQGKLMRLVTALTDEYALLSGEEISLFIDRSALEWGDLWRNRIDDALGSTPFFIAIITPKYVRSTECRRELTSFLSHAKSLGLDRLLLPILYIDVDGLVEDSKDEVLAILARSQYIDWRQLRLRGDGDPEVLEAINAVATRMKELRKQYNREAAVIETKTDTELFDSVNDIVSLINESLSSWMESVEFDQVAGRVWTSTVYERLDRIKRLRRTGQSHSARLAVMKKLGIDLLPLAKNRLEKARNYSRLTIELDPNVNAALRYVEQHRELVDILDVLADGISEAMRNIEPADDAPSWMLPGELTQYSQNMVEAQETIKESMKYTHEANRIVVQWHNKLSNLRLQPENNYFEIA